MWEKYSDEEKDFLRTRWQRGEVDSVVNVLRGWRDRFVSMEDISSLSIRLARDFTPGVNVLRGRGDRLASMEEEVSSLFVALAGDFTIVPQKEWEEYTLGERMVLRMRWTEKKVEAVIGALKQKKGMPDVIPKFPIETALLDSAYDLRRIRLAGKILDSLNFPRAYLQGADFASAILQDARLDSTDMRGATLAFADLKGASLRKANLKKADLAYADLQGTNFAKADLEGAQIIGANLQGTCLQNVNLQKANLRFAKLYAADLKEANLQDADLLEAHFDYIYLWRVNLGAAKNIRDIRWGDSLETRYVIGEEKCADSTKHHSDFRRAKIIYRDLKTWYKKELFYDVVAEFHFRENEVRTKGSGWLVRQFRKLFLKSTYGYGSRPIWLLWYSLAVIGLFSVLFAVLTIPRKIKSGIYLIQAQSGEKEKPLPFRRGRLFLDCLYFSALSFATFGYGALQPRQWLQFFRLEPVEYKPVRWARIFVGIEAALGIYIFALLVTVLFGRG